MFYHDLKHSSLAFVVMAFAISSFFSPSVFGQTPANDIIGIQGSPNTEPSLFSRTDLDDNLKINWAELHARYGQQLEKLNWGEEMALGRFDTDIDYSLDPAEFNSFIDALREEK